MSEQSPYNPAPPVELPPLARTDDVARDAAARSPHPGYGYGSNVLGDTEMHLLATSNAPSAAGLR